MAENKEKKNMTADAKEFIELLKNMDAIQKATVKGFMMGVQSREQLAVKSA